jgi:hypothetical protein
LAPAQTNEVQPRQGLLSRLRSRRAR